MTDEQKLEEQGMDPEDYFANIKSKKQQTTDEFLATLYDNMQVLLKKAYALGQTKVINKLLYSLEVLEKERELYTLGFRSFVYRDDVEYYMDKVSDKAVKIINLEEYPREIPDEVAEQLLILKEKKIFDVYYIVFTDYTGQVEREVAEERKRKDPILFGTFAKRERAGRLLHDRFYYIADWIDEYCDLTFDKMVSEMSQQGKEIKRPVCIPDADLQTIRDYMTALQEQKDASFRVASSVTVKKKSFFDSVKFWKKK